jgi:thiol-disulfide isomerase/thioredoxin/uncharacterized membrane protein
MTSLIRPATWFLITVGLLLAMVSGTDLCNFGGCTDAHQYRLFGLPLPLVGACFFLAYGTAELMRRFELALFTGDLLLAGAVGAEVTFIHLQKNIIQAWCPLCLGIAAVVGLLAGVRIFGRLPHHRRNQIMSGKLGSKSLLLLTAAVLSFFITLGGMSKPAAQAGELNLTLGKQNSKVEIYVFSDWFCPSCIKAEPAIEAAFPTMLQKAKVLFVDKPIHPEAMNFVPYHLAFAAREKSKYLELRKVLFALARRTKNPSAEDVKSAIAPLKVTYQQLSFLEVSQSMARFQALAEQFKVKGTPTMILLNSSTKKTRTLYGANEISTEGILKAIRELD